MAWQEGPGSRKPRVVCIDDDPEVLASLKRLFRREPYEFLLTEHPARVLEWICEQPVDLIIADQRMPEMDGVSLLEVVRDYSPDTACLILSGFPDTAVIVEESGLSIERLVSKPWDNEDLRESIHRLLDKRGSYGNRDGQCRDTLSFTTPAPALEGIRQMPAWIRIDCSGKNARAVAAQVLAICEQAPTDGKRPKVVLENVRRLDDSLSRLLKGLARAVAWFHLPIDLRDESGCIGAFLDAMTGRLRVRGRSVRHTAPFPGR
ncbi:MAG TPA: response regulator [Planctomycetota bacterium]|nr:response regulator [Planctomycetota bacterium]